MRRVLVVCALLAGCARDPVAEVCPPAAAGDLVITELRPEQGGTYAQWIELYNASGPTVDLQGTLVDVLSIDGGTHLRLLVREPLDVPAGAYVALGDGAEPKPYLAYQFGADFEQEGTPKDLPSAGRISISACGVEIDRLDYDSLPDEGSYALGADPPTAEANDDPTAWCADTTPSSDTTELGLPGSPGEANPPCGI